MQALLVQQMWGARAAACPVWEMGITAIQPVLWLSVRQRCSQDMAPPAQCSW